MSGGRPSKEPRKRNKTLAKAYAVAYYARNKEKFSIAARRREHVKCRLPSDLTEDQWLEAVDHFESGCAYCGSGGRLQKEHVHPLSLGGGFTRANIVPACVSCNQSKKHWPLDKWFKYQPFYSDGRLLRIVHWIYGKEGFDEVSLLFAAQDAERDRRVSASG